MFIGGSLTLNSPGCSSTIAEAAKAVWRRLRFGVPELAVSAGYGEDGNAYMQYEVPQSDEAVNHWVERTTLFKYGKEPMGFEALLDFIRQKKKGRNSEQVLLFLHLVKEDGDDLVKKIDLMLNADHQITDGVGIRILLDRYLALLAQALSVPHKSQEELDWRKSAMNLSSPWITFMNEAQRISGPEYERLAKDNEEFLLEKMVSCEFIPLSSSTHGKY